MTVSEIVSLHAPCYERVSMSITNQRCSESFSLAFLAIVSEQGLDKDLEATMRSQKLYGLAQSKAGAKGIAVHVFKFMRAGELKPTVRCGINILPRNKIK